MTSTVTAATGDPADPLAADRTPVGCRSRVRWALGIVAAVLCLVAIPLPLWKATLEAPQYHGAGALQITAYGDKLVGDICEINDLNHYIGMQRLGEPTIPCGSAALGRGENTVGRIAPEMVLWLPSAILASIACIVAMRTRRRWVRFVTGAFLVGLPVGVLVMTQYHLYIFGHDLDPEAAFHPDPFTPHVLWRSKIYQFDVAASTGAGLNLVIIAAVLITLGPWMVTKGVTWLLPKAAPQLAKTLHQRWNVHVCVAALVAMGAWVASGVAAPSEARASGSGDAVAMGAALAARFAAARPGDVVTIDPGVYRGNFVIDHGIEVVGIGRPILDGGGVGTVVTITEPAHGTRFSGIDLTGSGPGPSDTPAALRVQADAVTVEDVTISESYTGIQVAEADSVHIVGCRVEGVIGGVLGGELHATGGSPDVTGTHHAHHQASATRMLGDAISLLSTSHAVIDRNTITGARDGVYMSFASDAVVSNNHVHHSRYAIHGMYAERLLAVDNHFDGNLAGAILMYGGPFEVSRNTILASTSPSTGFGLVIKDGVSATIDGNVIVSNRVGLKIDNGGANSAGGVGAIVTGNTVAMNQIGVELMTASTAAFSRNGFVENTLQVVADGNVKRVEWSTGSTGNNWSNYKGYDSDGDGIGDIEFVQGGTIAHTLTRSPSLLALASGPGFRILQAVEDRWAAEDPIAVDHFPMMSRVSPDMSDSTSGRMPSPAAPTWFTLVGVAIALVSSATLILARRPREASDV